MGIRDEVAVASKVLKSLLGSAVRRAYKERGEPIWNVWKAEDDIDKAAVAEQDRLAIERTRSLQPTRQPELD